MGGSVTTKKGREGVRKQQTNGVVAFERRERKRKRENKIGFSQ